ncbi:MAG: hypothetical protein AAGC44_02280 [Planctomycetota bacterium]
MGWFLTHGKKNKKKATARRGQSAGPSWDPKRTLLGLKFAGAIGAVIGVALAWHLAEERLLAHANTRHASPVTPDDIVFSEEPRWMTPAEINQLRANIASHIAPGPMERSGLEQVVEELREHPRLVQELRQVRRTPEGTIELDVSFRKPAAILRMRNPVTNEPSTDGYHVIDPEGYALFGPVHLHDVYHLGLPRIEYVSSDYRPRDNQGEFRWQGNEVAAGLALIEQLKGDPVMDVIETIRVDGRDERQRIRLVLIVPVRPTAASEPIRCAIVWGMPPGQERSIEADADQKLLALRRVLADGNFRHGLWREVWVNTGSIRFPNAIRP